MGSAWRHATCADRYLALFRFDSQTEIAGSDVQDGYSVRYSHWKR
jgi:hypothetical protein